MIRRVSSGLDHSINSDCIDNRACRQNGKRSGVILAGCLLMMHVLRKVPHVEIAENRITSITVISPKVFWQYFDFHGCTCYKRLCDK
jgi:hypothetical protein